jgi:hypothetical protein
MLVFTDRFSNRMQIIFLGDLTPYNTVEVVVARGDHTQGEVVYTTTPNPNLLFPWSFDTNLMADLYLIGLKPDGEKVVLDAKPLRGGLKNENLLLRQERVKVLEQRKRRLSLAEWVILYLRQSRQRCSCWNKAYDLPTAGCGICGGTGVVTSYLGVRSRMAIPDGEQVAFQKEATGDTNIRQHQRCFAAAFPYIQDKDIVERGSGERYFVQKTEDQRLGDEMVGQEFNLVSVQNYVPFRFTLQEELS